MSNDDDWAHRLAEWRQIEAGYRMTPEQVGAWWRWFHGWPGDGIRVVDPNAHTEAAATEKHQIGT